MLLIRRGTLGQRPIAYRKPKLQNYLNYYRITNPAHPCQPHVSALVPAALGHSRDREEMGVVGHCHPCPVYYNRVNGTWISSCRFCGCETARTPLPITVRSSSILTAVTRYLYLTDYFDFTTSWERKTSDIGNIPQIAVPPRFGRRLSRNFLPLCGTFQQPASVLMGIFVGSGVDTTA